MSIRADLLGDAVVIQLADSSRKISVQPKRLWITTLIRNCLAKDLRVGQNAGAVWVESRQHGIATWTAQRELAIRSVKPHAARGQSVDVGRFYNRMAVTSQRVIQVVRHQVK